MSNLYNPIPTDIKYNDAKDISIMECNEELISIGKLQSKKIMVISQYYLAGISGSMQDCYARKGVCELLLKASNLLPQNHKLVVWDAFRPFDVQKHLFQKFYNINKLKFPNADENELVAITRKFVALPSTDKNKPSPHITGGAIDLSILDDKNNYLSMGTEFDHFGDEAATNYYELKFNNKLITEDEIQYLNNRRLLYNCMTSVGFTNYYDEWWHYDYGNLPWARSTNTTAIYGLSSLPIDTIHS